MSDMPKIEKARAASEARDALVSRPAGSSAHSVAAALRLYLGAEQYHELGRHGGELQDGEPVPVGEHVAERAAAARR
jgi:hypothetical protein